MSRSKRKTKITGITTATSEKEDKRCANRKFRRIVRQKLTSGNILVLPKLRELSDVWIFKKDGKTYKPNMSEKELRK